MRNKIAFIIQPLVLAFLMLAQAVNAQLQISGQSCVTEGATYTYTLNNCNSTHPYQWCVNGGTIIGSGACGGGVGVCSVSIQWTSGNGKSIDVHDFNNNQSGNYPVTVSSTLNGGAISNTSQTIAYNAVPATISCSAASGGGCGPTYFYQWQQSIDGGNWSDIPGATAQDLSFSSGVTQRTYYRRRVGNSGQETWSTNIATVNILPPLSGGNINPPTQQIFTGQPATQLDADASGGNCSNAYSYQWLISENGTDFNIIPGATGKTYSPGELIGTRYFKRQVTCGSEVANSSTAIVYVYAHLSVSSITPPSGELYYNTSPGQLTATASGGICSSYSYQWQYCTNGSTWQNVSNAASATYNPGNLTRDISYRLRVECGSETVYAGPVVFTVDMVGGTINPATQPAINYNGTANQLTLSGVDGGDGNYTYQWQYYSPNNFSWQNIAGATGTTYTPTNVTATWYFQVIIHDYKGDMAVSSAARVNLIFSPGSISGNTGPLSYGSSPGQLSGTSAIGGDCDNNFTYQWQQSINGTQFVDIPYATGLNYTPGDLTGKMYFRRRANCGSQFDYSNTLTILVNPELFPGTVTPDILTISSGTNPGTLTANPASGGTCSSYDYQWQQSTDGITFTNISGATSQHYTPSGNLTVTTYYRRRVDCGTSFAYTNTSIISVGTLSSTNLNYIRVRDITKPQVTTASAAQGLTDPKDVKQTTQYFDGLGRLMQTVIKQSSPLGKDMVVPTVYDQFGREITKYLPYVAAATDGEYKTDALPAQNSFNNGQFQGEQFYYGQTLVEASPLNRVQTTYAPGQNWVGNNRGVSQQYLINTPADNVQIWNIAPAAGSLPVNGGAYLPGRLFKIVTIDEHGKKVMEYKDKEGKVILRKVQLDNNPSADHGGWLCTYYVYDKMNNLRYVLQPRAVELITNNWILTQSIADEFCFRYEYDQRNRMIVKKTPGAGEVYMVYDVRDRLVFTQDANMRVQTPNQWLVNLYDGLNRLVLTALINYTSTRTALQDAVTSQTSGVAAGLASDHTLPTSEQTGTISGVWQAYNSITLQPNSETNTDFESGTEFTAEIVNGASESVIEGVVVNRNPIPAGVTLNILTKTGYDDYTTIPSPSGLTGNIDNTYTGTNYVLAASNTFPYPEAVNQGQQTRGLVTWTQTRVLGITPETYLYGINIYDEKERLIQQKAKNNTGGTDIATNQYSFSNQLLVTVDKDEKPGPDNPQNHIVVTKMTYDPAGRLESVKKTINSTINGVSVIKPEVEIVHNDYNELGQLKTKTLSPTGGAGGTLLQELDFAYNIRGWLLGINRDYLTTEGQTSDGIMFGFELGYDKIANKAQQNFNNSQYNGNITGMLWKSDGDDIRRKYDFTYDATNRLLSANFIQQNADDHQWNDSKVNFSVKMGDGIDPLQAYDANGNIIRMQQWGLKINGSTQIDDLRYSYHVLENSNRLRSVTEQTGAIDHKLGDFTDNNTSGNDYEYDVNGNLISDKNKRITGITYNHLNLPQQVSVADQNGNAKGTIVNVYDATGNKLQKTTTEDNASVSYNGDSYLSAVTTITKYLHGGVYESKMYGNAALAALGYTDKLQFISHEEGRTRFIEAEGPTAAHFEYDYFIKDHLGNVRMVLTEEKKQDQYPAVTFEDANIANEQIYYEKVDVQRVIRSGDGSNKSQLLRKSTQSIGAGKLLKVMATDRLHVKVDYFTPNETTDNSNANGVDAVISQLLTLINSAAAPGPVHGNGGIITTNLENSFPFTSFLQPQVGTSGTDKPKAYLNILFFDEQFKFVPENSEIVPVETKGSVSSLTRLMGNAKVASKNGYVYIYVSNESNNFVYFDNLQVTHERGVLLEETHYYPFGLTMAGISSKALKPNYAENKYKFNGIEQNNDFDINMYDAFYRNLDPQIGRFWQLDPKPMDESSLYSSMNNNPVLNIDPLGDTTIYYNSSGTELMRTTDNSKFLGNAVTVIPDENMAGFGELVGLMNGLGVNMNGSIATFLLRATGESYDVQSAFDLFDANADNYATNPAIVPTDGKGPLIGESSAPVEKKINNVWTVSVKDIWKQGEPAVSQKLGGDITIHTHDNEGRKISVAGRAATVASGKESTDNDRSMAKNKPGTGRFEMAVGKNAVYFFNQSGVAITVNRDAFAPKYFKKK